MAKCVAVVATLDTKGAEVSYICKGIVHQGKETLLIDSGILGEPIGIQPDITRYDVASNAGYELKEIRSAPSRGDAVSMMAEGIKKTLLDLFNKGKIDGVLCLGGAGTMIALPGMKSLPLGVPKLLITPLASGIRTFEPYVGTSDMMIVHSVVDIMGVNDISKKIYDNAIAAICGMVTVDSGPVIHAKNLIAITMFGNTTPGVEVAKKFLENAGYECIIFHANGVGGRCMEELIKRNTFVGVLDYTLSEVAGEEIGGLNKSSPERLEVAGKFGVPQVIVPGCIDFLDIRPEDSQKAEYKNRAQYKHSPEFILVRTSKEEMERLGKIVAEKLNRANAPVAVLFPLKGLSIPNIEGGELYDPEADRAFLHSLKGGLSKDIELIEINAHVNDGNIAILAAQKMIELISKNRASQN